MAKSFSKTFVGFAGRTERRLEITVGEHIYEVEVLTEINDVCGYTSFKLDGVYEEGCVNIPEGQLQICWEEDEGVLTDDLNVFFYCNDHPKGVVVYNERI